MTNEEIVERIAPWLIRRSGFLNERWWEVAGVISDYQRGLGQESVWVRGTVPNLSLKILNEFTQWHMMISSARSIDTNKLQHYESEAK